MGQTGKVSAWWILSPFCQQNYSPGKWGKGVLWAPALAKPDGIQVGDVQAGTALKLFVPQ